MKDSLCCEKSQKFSYIRQIQVDWNKRVGFGSDYNLNEIG